MSAPPNRDAMLDTLLLLAAIATPQAPRMIQPDRGPQARRGFDATSERVIAAGLDWLARHQSDDGSWDADTEGVPPGPQMSVG